MPPRTDHTSPWDGKPICTFSEVRELIGYRPGDRSAIGWEPREGEDDLHAMVADLAPGGDIDALVDEHAGTGNVFWGVNTTTLAAGSRRRGTTDEIARAVTLVADLDIKEGCFTSYDGIHSCIGKVSEAMGTRPVAIIYSGHGAQPIWILEPDEAAALSSAEAAALLDGFGQLVAMMALELDAQVDSVFDLPRILRVPGTINWKAEPVPVVAVADTGAPLSVAVLTDRLLAYSIDPEQDPVGDEVIAPPELWIYNQITKCRYAPAMVKGWATDKKSAVHPWHVSQSIRLECARRLECLHDADAYEAAKDALDRRYSELLTGRPLPRKPDRKEINRNRKYAITRVSRMTDERVRAELGNHRHADEAQLEPGARANDGVQVNGAALPKKSSGRVVTLLKAGDLKDGVPEWVWAYDGVGRLMRHTLVLFAGRPGAGKSTAARWFAASYSTGTLAGCFEGKPQYVAYIASEESLEYMVKPSLRAVGADMDRIYFPRVEVNDELVPLLSTADQVELTAQFKAHAVTVVVVDPMMSTIGSHVDINKNNQTRTYIEPWARIADEIGGMCIGVVHLTKAPGGDIVAAINGSSAFGEVARGVIAFAKDPASEAGHRIMSQVKNSAGPEDLSLAYELAPTVVTTDGGIAEVVRFTIVGPSERTVSDVMLADKTLNRLGPRSWEVIELARTAAGPITPKDVEASVPAMTNNDAGTYLRRLTEANILMRVGRGQYIYRIA